MVKRSLIYTPALAVLGLRAVEFNLALESPWYELAQVTLATGIWSIVIAWFRVERDSATPAREAQLVSTTTADQSDALSALSDRWHVS